MKKILILVCLLARITCAMENSVAIAHNIAQADWLPLPQELWIEIIKCAIGDEQSHENRLKTYCGLVLTNKKLNNLMQSTPIQQTIKKYVYAEVEKLCVPQNDINQLFDTLATQTVEQMLTIPVEKLCKKVVKTPVEKAIELDKSSYLYFYLKDNPDKLNNVINDLGDTMLHLSCKLSTHGNRIFDFLLSKNPAVDQQNNSGDTPLHNAVWVRDNNWRLLRLKEKGANLYIRNNGGMSPIDLIAKYELDQSAPLNQDNTWKLINELVPQEHKSALNIKTISNYSHLSQLHYVFWPKEQKPPTKKARYDE